MLNRLHIENFKGFEKFDVGFMPITIFGGKNNSCKTSILEAIFLCFSYSNVNCFSILNALRHVNMMNAFTPDNSWAPLFYNFDLEKSLKLEVFNDNNESAELLLALDDNYLMPQNLVNSMPMNIVQSGIGSTYALKFNFISPFYNEDGHYIINNSGMRYYVESHNDKKRNKPQGVFLFKYDHFFDPNIIAQWCGKVLLTERKKYIIECLKLFDDDIIDLQTIVKYGVGYLYASFKDGRSIPINYMGDGMNRLIDIALCILANENSIILIDEIENGFHYSMQPKVWEIVGKAASISNCQIITNTHSSGMIHGAVEGLKNIDAFNKMSYVRMENYNGRIVPHVFDSDMMEYALASEMEVR